MLRMDWLAMTLALGPEIGWIVGGIGDWTTLRDGESESGGRGRKNRTGMLRNGCDCGGRRMLDIRWKFGRSTDRMFST